MSHSRAYRNSLFESVVFLLDNSERILVCILALEISCSDTHDDAFLYNILYSIHSIDPNNPSCSFLSYMSNYPERNTYPSSTTTDSSTDSRHAWFKFLFSLLKLSIQITARITAATSEAHSFSYTSHTSLICYPSIGLLPLDTRHGFCFARASVLSTGL